jgi:hypothetical protein
MRYGIINALTLIKLACEEKHKHYEPTHSVFLAYAESLDEFIPQIRNRANRLIDGYVEDRKKNEVES